MFAVTSECEEMLMAGQEVTFNPAGTTPQSGSLMVYDDVAGSPQSVPLSATTTSLIMEALERIERSEQAAEIAVDDRRSATTSPVALAVRAFYIPRKSRQRRTESWRSRADACAETSGMRST